MVHNHDDEGLAHLFSFYRQYIISYLPVQLRCGFRRYLTYLLLFYQIPVISATGLVIKKTLEIQGERIYYKPT